MIWIGIDPGVQGAVALIHPNRIELLDTPVRKVTRGHDYEDAAMAELLRPYSFPYAGPELFVTLEAVQVRPNETGTSALKIGKGWGTWKGILAALAIPHEVIQPQAWKKHYSLVAQDKKASRAKAQELFPEIAAELGKRRPDHSEALLIAAYGRHRHSHGFAVGPSRR